MKKLLSFLLALTLSLSLATFALAVAVLRSLTPR